MEYNFTLSSVMKSNVALLLWNLFDVQVFWVMVWDNDIGHLLDFYHAFEHRYYVHCVILRFGRGKPKEWQSIYPKLFSSLAELL